MTQSSICRRCHRLRAVNNVRYCAPCAEQLRKMGASKHRALPVPEEPTPVDPLASTLEDASAPLEEIAPQVVHDTVRAKALPLESDQFVLQDED